MKVHFHQADSDGGAAASEGAWAAGGGGVEVHINKKEPLSSAMRNAHIFRFFFQYLFLFSFAETQKWRSDIRSPAVAVSHLVKSLEAEKISHN